MAKGDIISRLKLESGEFDSKIKRAGQELLAYSEHCRKMGLEMGYANRDAKEFAKALGSMQTVSQTARGKINELSEAFVNAKVMYKNMTDEEKKGEFGKNLAKSLDQLKGRLDAAKKDLADVQKELNGGGSKFGEFGNVIDTLGSKLGVTGNLTEMLTSKTALLTGAVGAGIAVVTKATEAWAKYNAELARQDQITTVTTGLKGDDADRMTDKMRALSDTYKVDFREAVNAANTLMTQFGKTGDEATQLIKDGMRGMIQGDGPKLLQMIQQYAPAFRDAGVSASQLVAVIQNSEGGIFTDQNMNAIVMGIKNIRLMTKATSDALAQLGIDGEKMSRQLSDGSLTIFDALKQVANQIQTVDSNSKEAGEVMQQVFGRQGAMAGTKLGEAIATLNTNLEETKRQTGEVGEAFSDLQEANERLNTAIRDAFGYDGWDKMATGIKTKLVGALADVIDHLAIIEEGFGKLFGRGNNKPKSQKEADTSKFGSYQVTTDSDGNVLKATKWNRGKAIDMTDYERNQQGVVVTGRLNLKKTGSGGGNKNTLKEDKDEFTEIIGLIGNAQERVSDLQKQIRESWDEGEIAKLTKELKVAEDEVKRLKDIGKPVDLEKMFPDYSKQNYNTGYAGSTKAKIDSARQDFALSTTNFDTINSYISGIKNALKDADLGSDLYNSLTEQLKDATTMSTMLQELMERGLQGADLQSVAEKFKTALLEGDVPDDKIKEYIDKLNEQIKNAGGIELSYNEKTGEVKDKDKKKSDRDVLKDSKQLVSGLSQVASGLNQMGIQLPKEIQDVLGFLNGLMSVIEGIQTIIGVFQVSAITANTAALVANTAALAVNTAVPSIFANGGVVHAAGGWSGFVPGNNYSGDMVPAMLNSGELVLNRAQQGNLASQLTGGGGGGNSSLPYVDGETIYLGMNNYLMRSGRGEIVTSRR